MTSVKTITWFIDLNQHVLSEQFFKEPKFSGRSMCGSRLFQDALNLNQLKNYFENTVKKEKLAGCGNSISPSAIFIPPPTIIAPQLIPVLGVPGVGLGGFGGFGAGFDSFGFGGGFDCGVGIF